MFYSILPASFDSLSGADGVCVVVAVSPCHISHELSSVGHDTERCEGGVCRRLL